MDLQAQGSCTTPDRHRHTRAGDMILQPAVVNSEQIKRSRNSALPPRDACFQARWRRTLVRIRPHNACGGQAVTYLRSRARPQQPLH